MSQFQDPPTLSVLRKKYDTQGMYAHISNVPQYWEAGLNLASGWGTGIKIDAYRQVLVIGMGGSAIGGDLLRTLASPVSPVPVLVSRSYEIPGYVGPETLVIASSYSGNTEETLAACEAARQAGAKIVAITTGGALLKGVDTHGWPHIQLPTGMSPRAALAYSLSALVQLGRTIGLIPLPLAGLQEATAMLKEMVGTFSDFSGNPAQQLAEVLHGSVPLIYSGTGLMEAVNLRWRCQIQENAKSPAYGSIFPEHSHNEIEAWRKTDPFGKAYTVVVLRDAEDHPRVQKRMDISREIIAPMAGAWEEVTSSGKGRLTRLLSMVYFGDWVSYYLALYRHADPSPIPNISKLKNAL